jgi:hypothetical protein
MYRELHKYTAALQAIMPPPSSFRSCSCVCCFHHFQENKMQSDACHLPSFTRECSVFSWVNFLLAISVSWALRCCLYCLLTRYWRERERERESALTNPSTGRLTDSIRTAQPSLPARCFQNYFPCVEVLRSTREQSSLIVRKKRRTAFIFGETVRTVRRKVSSVMAATRHKKRTLKWRTIR